MSDRLFALTSIRHDLTSTQALIDQARAHLYANSHKLDAAQTCLFLQGLDERQAMLDRTKARVNALSTQS